MTNKYVDAIKRVKAKVSYAIAGAKLDFAVDLQRLLDQQGLKRADLAERIGKSRPYVTKLLTGDGNPTIETMVKTVHALGGRVHIKVSGTGEHMGFFRVPNEVMDAIAQKRRSVESRNKVERDIKAFSQLREFAQANNTCANDEFHAESTVAAA